MFELSNVEGHISIKFVIIGYQFPSDPIDDWLLVKLTVKQGNNVFEKIDPALTTQELINVYQWFNALHERKLPRFGNQTFTEPCIGLNFLAYRSDTVRFSIELSHELKPNFFIEQFKFPNKDKWFSKDWHIVFEANNDDFIQILNSLTQDISNYPTRSSNHIDSLD